MSIDNEVKNIIDFIEFAEGMKIELRHATKSNSQRESVADHAWRLSLMLMLTAPKLKLKINLLKALKMAIIHDIVEIEAKDVPALKWIDNEDTTKKKMKDERKAIESIRKRLGDGGQEIFKLWNEFEEAKTNEAKVVKGLDKLEGQLQFLRDPVRKFTGDEQDSIKKLFIESTNLCKIDPFLSKLDEITMEDRKKRTAC